MTITGFKKAFNPDTFFLIKTTGNVDHFKSNMKGDLIIDEENQLIIYTDKSGFKFTVDINDVSLISDAPQK